MSDLIRRDKAIEIIEKKQKELCPVGMYSRSSVYGQDRDKFDAWEEIIDELNYIPVAFDVENVVGQLEEYKSSKENLYVGKVVGAIMDYAIAIVKAGGIDE